MTTPRHAVNNRFFLKPGYRQNLEQHSFDHNEGTAYWTDWRLEASAIYQYDVYLLARNLLLDSKFDSVMDVGSGPATKVRELIAPVCRDIALVDQPSTAQLIERYLPGTRFVAADLSRIDTVLDRQFDIIICADVLEHLVDPDPCLDFIGRHLSARGLAVISTPERDNLRGTECNCSPMADHVREWSADEFASYITSRGWTIEQQLLLPQQRLSSVEMGLRKLFGANLLRKRWASCQTVVCRPDSRRQKTVSAV